jgi:hypothetical protein
MTPPKRPVVNVITFTLSRDMVAPPVGVLHDVVVGDDVTARIDEESRAQPTGRG